MRKNGTAELKAKVSGLRERIDDFLTSHSTEVQKVTTNLPHVFEAFCYVLVIRYFESAGYAADAKGLYEDKFRFKFSTRGNPWNYSYFQISPKITEKSSTNSVAEVWHNQLVAGYWPIAAGADTDFPTFAADVAVVSPRSIPTEAPKKQKGKVQEKPRTWVRNQDLITFGEVKSLVAYPMLLAQFYGTVHEIMPRFLEHSQWKYALPPLYPMLFTDNMLTDGAKKVILSFAARDLTISVIPNVSTAVETELLELMGKGIRHFVEKEKFIGKGEVADNPDSRPTTESQLKLFEDFGL